MLTEAKRITQDIERCGVPVAGFGIAIAVLALNLAWIAATDITANTADFAVAVGAGFLFICMTVTYAAYRKSSTLAAAIGTFGVMLLNANLSGLQAMLGLNLGFPLVDAQLAAIDELFLIDHRAIILWLVDRPLMATLLGIFYRTTVPMMLTIGLFLAFSGQFSRLRPYLLIYALIVAITSLLSTLTPAIGSFMHYGLAEDAARVFPKGSGIYHLEDFHILRQSRELMLGPFDVAGVVTFPSLHCGMALLIAYGAWQTLYLRWFGAVYMVGTLIATVPIGGHYVVDLAGGGMIFCLAVLLAHRPVASFSVEQPVLKQAH